MISGGRPATYRHLHVTMADDAPAAEEAAAAPRDAAFAPPPTYDRNTLLRQLEYYFSDVRHAPCKPARARPRARAG